jgi:hypothetical protein
MGYHGGVLQTHVSYSEDPKLNINPNTSSPSLVYYDFSWSLQKNARIPQDGPQLHIYTAYPINYSLNILSFNAI